MESSIIEGDRCIDCQALDIQPLETQQYFFGRDLPARFKVCFHVHSSTIELLVSVHDLFRKREDFRYRDFVPLYYRASCSAVLVEDGRRGSTGHGICEYLYIDRS